MRKDPKYERYRWLTFGITWLIYASLYLTRKTFSVAKVAFADDPRVTMQRADFGYVDSAYLTAYALGQFIWGALGDRIGPRRVLLIGMFICVAAATATGFSTTLVAFVVLAVVQGIGQSAGWSNTIKTMSAWFSLHERGRIMGWWCTNYAVGAAIALPAAGGLMEWFGTRRPAGQPGTDIIPYWPAGYWGTAGVLGGVLALTWWLLRNKPEDVGLPAIEEYHEEPESVISDEDPSDWRSTIRSVLSTPRIWMLGIAYFSIKLTRYAFYFWGPKYISESMGTDEVGTLAASVVAMALPLGGVLGVVITGYLSDRVFQSRRMPITVLSLLLAAAVMLMGLNPIHNLWILGAFFFLVGFFLFGPDSIISGTASMDFGTKHGAGTAAGFVNGVGSIGAILGGFLPGKITTESNWTPLFYVFIGGILFSAAVLAPLWKTLPPHRSDTSSQG